MSSKAPEPRSSSAQVAVLFFSRPPRESPSLVKTVAAVSGVHALVLIVVALTLLQRDHLQIDTAFAPPQLLETDFVSLSYAGMGDRLESSARAKPRSGKPAR